MLARYEDALAATQLAERTRRAYRSRVAGYLDWLAATDIDGDPLTDPRARNDAVRDYRVHLITVAERKPATVNATLTALDHFHDWLGLGPAVVQREDLPAAAPRALDDGDQRRFLRSVEQQDSPRDRALALTLFYSGVRVAELAALDVGDVALSTRKGRVIVREGTGERHREIPLHPAARTALRAWLRDRRSWPGADGAALWLNRRGGRLSARSIEQVVGAVGRAAHLDDPEAPLTPQVLRHTFATRLLRQGVDVVVVADLLGHRRLDTVRRHSPPTAADREQAIDRLLDAT